MCHRTVFFVFTLSICVSSCLALRRSGRVKCHLAACKLLIKNQCSAFVNRHHKRKYVDTQLYEYFLTPLGRSSSNMCTSTSSFSSCTPSSTCLRCTTNVNVCCHYKHLNNANNSNSIVINIVIVVLESSGVVNTG